MWSLQTMDFCYDKQCYCVLFFNSHVDDTTNVMILNQSISVLSIFIFHPIQLVHKSNFLELTSYTVNLAESYHLPLSLYQKITIGPLFANLKGPWPPYFFPIPTST